MRLRNSCAEPVQAVRFSRKPSSETGFSSVPLPAMKTGSQAFQQELFPPPLRLAGQAFSARTLPRPPPLPREGERGGEFEKPRMKNSQCPIGANLRFARSRCT